jgi:hypothetical protein
MQKTLCSLPRGVAASQDEEVDAGRSPRVAASQNEVDVTVNPVDQDAASLDDDKDNRFLGFGCKLGLNSSISSVWNNIKVSA